MTLQSSDSNFKQQVRVERVCVRIVAARGARALRRLTPSEKNKRAQGSRMRAAPAVSCAKNAQKSAHEHTGSAEAIRLSLRSGFTAYSVLSPVTGFLATVIPKELAPQELDASIGAPGPHGFAVRAACVRLSQAARPPHPTARFVTIASRPSHRVRRAKLKY
jgi:hypothetical protein